MKRFVSLTIITLILLFCINIVAFGYYEDEQFAENDFYIVVTFTESEDVFRASGTKTGSKTITGYNDDNEKLWDATIHCSFSYTGSSATCTAASITYNEYSSKWKITSATTTRSGNTATGNITAKKYVLGIPVQTVEETISITCSADGTLS